jgi:hypothetical protein
MKVMRRLFAGLAAGAMLLLTAAPAFAHDCFNPNKPEGAGVNYTITAFTATGPVFEQTGPGQGIGGFVTIAPDVLGPGSPAVEVHTLGNSTAKEEVGGPGSMKPEHACDGKGIDYLGACLGG